MIQIRTERLTLRQWYFDDADALLEIRSLPEVSKWLSSPDVWTGIDEALGWIHRSAQPDDTLGEWALVPHSLGQPIGSASLHRTPDDSEFEIGWFLHPDHAGKGYASEAARGVLDHAWRAEVKRVWAIMWPNNDASARLAAAIGMTDLGVIDDPWYGSEEEPTSRMFRIDRPANEPVD